MLNSIHIENFRKHANLTVDFTPGINTIRAPNEAGKTTLLEAVAYAYFGTKGLKESLDDVVTYDIPVGKLKVDHTFTMSGVQYRIVRSKSGAELTAPGVTVTGQTEVTKFVEALFGTSADMAAKLMMAKQKALGGALSEGTTAAGKMIEDLADLSLIDELVGLIGEHLPAGQTASAEGTIAALRAQTEVGDLPDLEPLQLATANAAMASEKAVVAHKLLKAEHDQLDLDQARSILTEQKVLTAAVAERAERLAAAEQTLAAKSLEAPAPAEIDKLRAQVEAQKELGAANKLHDELEAAKIEGDWDEPMAALEAEIKSVESCLAGDVALADTTRAKVRKLADDIQKAEQTYKLAYAKLEGKLIKDTTCALCQKDLKDVPEVALINNPLSAELLKMHDEHDEAVTALGLQKVEVAHSLLDINTRVAEQQIYMQQLQAVLNRNAVVSLLYARAEKFITLDHSTVPALWTWVGPTGAAVDHTPKLRELEAARDAALKDATRRAAAEQLRTTLETQQKAAQEALAALQVKEAEETLAEAQALVPRVQAALEAAQVAERALGEAKQTFELARAKIIQAQENAEKSKVALAAAEASLVEMQANNLLIKKLREARPAITDKLWAIVLAAVSTYATDVRGERSVITRADGKFKINGRPITGLSGSAEDVLGLANRFALTKTFVPNIDFVILDEVAAACDDQRELAMLGLLATSGFAQTILVTHSPHADAFSDNVITI